jgi:hypothetical protein
MRTKKEGAASIQASPRYNQQGTDCHGRSGWSSGNLRRQLGEVLLSLQAPMSPKQRERFWCIFERKLRRYVALKKAGVLV